MQECFYPGGLENPQREQGENAEELEEDQRAGKGLPQEAGAGRESTSQRPRCAQPSCFSRAPVASWCFVPRKVSQRMLILPPASITSPSSPALQLPAELCLSTEVVSRTKMSPRGCRAAPGLLLRWSQPQNPEESRRWDVLALIPVCGAELGGPALLLPLPWLQELKAKMQNSSEGWGAARISTAPG